MPSRRRRLMRWGETNRHRSNYFIFAIETKKFAYYSIVEIKIMALKNSTNHCRGPLTKSCY